MLSMGGPLVDDRSKLPHPYLPALSVCMVEVAGPGVPAGVEVSPMFAKVELAAACMGCMSASEKKAESNMALPGAGPMKAGWEVL